MSFETYPFNTCPAFQGSKVMKIKIKRSVKQNDLNNKDQLEKKLERSKKYVGLAELDILYNQEEFQPQSYGDKSVKKVSKFMFRQFSSNSPSFAYMPVSINTIEDETFLFNVGQQKVHEYMSLKMKSTQLSSWTNYPSYYKFMSVNFYLNTDIL